jgi:hypothetical protein
MNLYPGPLDPLPLYPVGCGELAPCDPPPDPDPQPVCPDPREQPQD